MSSSDTTIPQVKHVSITVQENADLMVRVLERDYSVRVAAEEQHPLKKVTTIGVSQKVLKDLPSMQANVRGGKNPFRAMLTPNFKEGITKEIDIEEVSPVALEIVFRIYHDTLVDKSYVVPISEVWEVIFILEKYQINHTKAEAWFASWYTEKNTSRYPVNLSARSHAPESMDIYPCWIFNHALGFKEATHSLVYGTCHGIREENPTGHSHLHLPQRIIGMMNAARGRLKTILTRGLDEIWLEVDEKRCPCHEKTAHHYLKSLRKAGVWPVEIEYTFKSMALCLALLSNYSWNPSSTACRDCQAFPFVARVKKVVLRTLDYFDGLCLDCMDRSKPKRGDEDREYWEGPERDEWDKDCRISHKEPTFYFSYMGRPEHKRGIGRMVEM